MASYKNYTSAYNFIKLRWEIYDSHHNLVFVDSNIRHRNNDPIRDWVDNWSPEVINQHTNTSHAGPEIGEFKDIDLNSDYSRYGTDEFTADDLRGSGFFKSPPGLQHITPKFVTDALQKKVRDWRKRARQHGTQVPSDSSRVLGPEHIQSSRWNPDHYSYGRTINVLDLETVGTDTTKGSVLSYAALKMAHNLDTGNWDLVSKRTRYYYPTREDKLLKDAQGVPVFDQSIAVNGLTDANISSRRDAQAARYSKHWNQKELERLIRYLGKDPVLGHNISQFDWPKLFGASISPGSQLPSHALPPGGLIDTLHLAEGTRGTWKGANTNSMLYTLAYGRTPEQDGFTAHDALEDVQITMKVYQAMLKDPSRMGQIARYINKHPGLSTQFRDTMIKGITEVRGMTPEQQDIVNHLFNQADGDPLIEDIARTSFSGHSTSRAASLQSMGIDTSGLTTEIAELKDAITRLTAATESSQKAGLASSQIVREAAGLKTVAQRKEYLHSVLGVTGDPDAEDWNSTRTAAGYALNRANALFKARHAGQLEVVDSPVAGNPAGWSALDRAAWYNSNKWKYPDSSTYSDGKWSIVKTGRLGGGTGGLDKWQDNLWGPLTGSDPLLKLTGAANSTAGALHSLGTKIGEITDAYDKLFSAHQATDKKVYDAASYFIPKPLKEAGSRYFDAIQEFERSSHISRSKWGHLIGDVSGKGGFLQAGTNFAQGVMAQRAADKVSRIDLWAGFTELMLVPLRLLGSAFRALHKHAVNLGKAFLNIIASFRGLGIPLTNLTGVSYADMQRSYVGDAMIGAQNGSMNQSYNQFAGAQQDLFTFGQMDTTRVIAAAMTGTFGSVYANGGDTQSQFAATANTIAARIRNTNDPREKARLMNLAGKIDANLPTILQQMENIGVTDYSDIQSGRWLASRGIRQYTATKEQRAAYTRAGMEYTGLTESIGESRNMVAEKLWSFIGRDIMSAVNDIFHQLATGNWRDAIETAKTKAKEFWGRITKAIFGHEVSLGDVWEKVKGSIGAGVEGLVHWVIPKLAPLIADYVRLVSRGWAKIIEVAGQALDSLVERLKFLRIVYARNEDGSWGLQLRTLGHSKRTDEELSFGNAGVTGLGYRFATLQDLKNYYTTQGYEYDDPDIDISGMNVNYIDQETGELVQAKTIGDLEKHLRVFYGLNEYGNGIGGKTLETGSRDRKQAARILYGRNTEAGIMAKGSKWLSEGILQQGEFAANMINSAAADYSRKYGGGSTTLNFDLGGDSGLSITTSGEITNVSASGEAKAKIGLLGNYIGIGVHGQVVNLGSEGAQ